MLGQSIKQNAVGLSIFAIITAGVIAFTQVNTAERIERNEHIAKSKALYEILPRETHDNILLDDVVTITDPTLIADEGQGEGYIAYKDGKAIAVILPAIAPDGYTGKIHSIVGIRADSSIAGVRVIAHQETPGLGDKVEVKKSPWVLSFVQKSLTSPGPEGWAVIKDGGEFDQFTGATITPRAVVNSVKAALTYFDLHKDSLLANQPKATAETNEQASVQN